MGKSEGGSDMHRPWRQRQTEETGDVRAANSAMSLPLATAPGIVLVCNVVRNFVRQTVYVNGETTIEGRIVLGGCRQHSSQTVICLIILAAWLRRGALRCGAARSMPCRGLNA